MTRTQEKADEEAPEHFEHTRASLKTAASMLSQTTLAPSSDDGDGALTRGSSRELPTIMVEELAPEEISLWTCRTIGIPLGGFTLSFLNAVAMGVGYGFFLGYLGLDSYVMSAIQALMKLPEVLLLPLGLLNDCVAICGYHRKPYFVMSFAICACALLLMSLKPLPAPYYCQYPDGSYNYSLPPCNPEAHEGHGWYVGTLVLLNFGIQLGCVAGEGLLLEYAQLETPERRGTIKAEMTMVNMVGDLAAPLVVAFLMNGKEYLGTFTWGLSFCQLMGACCALALALLPITFFCVYEPRKAHPPSLRAHVKASYHLVRQRALASFLTFAFVVQLLVAMSTTAGNMVKSQWAGVKVLQQQLFGMINVGVMMASVWVYKTYFFQCSWRKVFMVSVVAVTAVDALPTFLTIFNVVRDQYFFLGEDVLRGVPMAAISLLSGLLMIEMSEPGREGLCFGLVATLQKSAVPLATVLSNQIFGLFSPSLSDLTNYLADTDSFRRTVALSYLVTFATSLSSLACVPLIPRQKAEAQRRKNDWGTSRHTAKLVILIPAACLVYSVAGLIMASDPHTACSQMAGGQGC